MPNKLIKEKLYIDKTEDKKNAAESSKPVAAAVPIKSAKAAAQNVPAAFEQNTAPKAAVQTALPENAAVKTPQSAATVQKTASSVPAASNLAEKTPAASISAIPPAKKSATDTAALEAELNKLYQTAADSAADKIDRETEASVLELRKAEEEAAASYKGERARIAANEARALDNAALYASLRGDSGGIGQAQYNSVMAAAENSRAAITAEQRKLANETAYEIAELQAQGGYEKADALLEIAQERLGKLTELNKWAAEYNIDEAKLNSEIEKWRAELNLKRDALAAETASEASAASAEENDAEALFEAMYASGNPYTFLISNAKKYGITGSGTTVFSEIMSEYRSWASGK